jgi:galactokinase
MNHPMPTEEILSRCVVDTLARKFYLYSSEGNERVVECETVDQFMNVLEVVRDQVSDDCLAYSNPL